MLTGHHYTVCTKPSTLSKTYPIIPGGAQGWSQYRGGDALLAIGGADKAPVLHLLPFLLHLLQLCLALERRCPHQRTHQVRLSTLHPLQSTNQHMSKQRGALTSLHGDPHGTLLRAPLVHARQLAQEPIWLQHHLKTAAQMRRVRGKQSEALSRQPHLRLK